MNDPHESLSDEALDGLLAPLRAATPSDEVRAANRASVRRALARRMQPPWWRRTVAVPLPIAIAATVIFALTAAALFWPRGVERTTLDPTKTELAATSAVPALDSDEGASPTWSVTHSYIRSLDSLAKLRVSWTPDATEKRDDS